MMIAFLNMREHFAALRNFWNDLRAPQFAMAYERVSPAIRVRRRRLRMERVVGFGLVAAFAVTVATVHAAQAINEGGRRALAERLTRAIAARDAESVRLLFAPGLGDAVVSDLRLGELADRFSDLGELHEVRVQSAGGGKVPWVMTATFAHGTQVERLRFIGDRVVAFSAGVTEMVSAAQPEIAKSSPDAAKAAPPTEIATEENSTW